MVDRNDIVISSNSNRAMSVPAYFDDELEEAQSERPFSSQLSDIFSNLDNIGENIGKKAPAPLPPSPTKDEQSRNNVGISVCSSSFPVQLPEPALLPDSTNSFGDATTRQDLYLALDSMKLGISRMEEGESYEAPVVDGALEKARGFLEQMNQQEPQEDRPFVTSRLVSSFKKKPAPNVSVSRIRVDNVSRPRNPMIDTPPPMVLKLGDDGQASEPRRWSEPRVNATLEPGIISQSDWSDAHRDAASTTERETSVQREIMRQIAPPKTEQGGPPAVFVEGCGQQPGHCVVWRLKVVWYECCTTTYRRYRNFVALKEDLAGLGMGVSAPFPPKVWGQVTTEDMLSRKTMLQAWITEAVEVGFMEGAARPFIEAFLHPEHHARVATSCAIL